MPAKDEFVKAARGWIGVKWLHQGRNRAGIDCVGLLLMASKDVGLDVPDLAGYRRSPDRKKFIDHINANSQPETTTQAGNFGIFRDGTQPCHVGIFAERDGVLTLIHAYAGTGMVMEEPYCHDWPKKLMTIRSVTGLE